MRTHIGTRWTTLCGRTPGGKHGLPVTRYAMDADCLSCLQHVDVITRRGQCYWCGARIEVGTKLCRRCDTWGQAYTV